MENQSDYSYETAGFDGFFNRSIDRAAQVNLSSPGVQSSQIAYDRVQVSGMLGDTLQVGNVHINKDNITLNDGSNDRLLIGFDSGGF